MQTVNNQIILDDLHDENVQPTEEDIIDYAQFIGIDVNEEPELLWIARQGVVAPLPKGWKAVQDPQGELYYFNFETGESIWDHPCDEDYKNMVIAERKVLEEKGPENYKPPPMESRQPSPTKGFRSPGNTLRNSAQFTGTSKSTSTISDVLNSRQQKGANNSTLRANEIGLYDTKDLANVEFEEEDLDKLKDEEEDEEEASWQKKSGESDGGDDSSDGFRKPVDFGIEKEISYKLDKLNVMLMVGKDSNKEPTFSVTNNKQQDLKINLNRASLEETVAQSVPSTSREAPLDSPTRNYVKAVLGISTNKSLGDEDFDLKKSLDLGSLMDEKSKAQIQLETQRDLEYQLKLFKESLEREFDQKRLELLENKDLRIRKMREETENEIQRLTESESNRLRREHDEKIGDTKRKLERELQSELESMRKRHADELAAQQKEFESEKMLRKEKFAMQISNYMKSNQSLEGMDENEEKRELAIYFEHIERKYADKCDDRKKELEQKYEKKMKEMEEELRQLYEEQSEKKTNEMKSLREQTMMLENYDRKMDQLLADRVKEFKGKEENEMAKIKEEYGVKIDAFKQKFKQLEENELNYLESEYVKTKERIEAEHKAKMNNLEAKLRINLDRLAKQEEDYKKRLQLLEEKRQSFNNEWKKLSEEESKLQDKKTELVESKALLSSAANNDHESNKSDQNIQMRFEIEKLKLEKADLVVKLQNMQLLLDKYSIQKTIVDERGSKSSDGKFNLNKFLQETSAIMNSSVANHVMLEDNSDNSELSERQFLKAESINAVDFVLDDENDDDEMKELIEHAKLKLKLKYAGEKKQAQISTERSKQATASLLIPSSSSTSSSENEDQEDKSGDAFNKLAADMSPLLDERGKQSLIDSLNKERETLQVANELIDRYKQSLSKRKLKLESVKSDLTIEEKALGKMGNKDTSKQKNGLENQRLELNKEELNLEQLGLHLKSALRLIRQKSLHLSALEENLLHEKRTNKALNRNSESDDGESSSMDEEKQARQKDLSSLIKQIPKLNSKLEKVLGAIDSMESTTTLKGDKTDTKYDPEFINEKWNRYLGKQVDQSVLSGGLKKDQNGYQIKINASWQNSPAYQRLTLDSGTRILDQKWNQYIGNTYIPPSRTGLLSNTFKLTSGGGKAPLNNMITSSGSVSSSVNITLPESTKYRLNQHREWLKKFKAESDFNKNLANL